MQLVFANNNPESYAALRLFLGAAQNPVLAGIKAADVELLPERKLPAGDESFVVARRNIEGLRHIRPYGDLYLAIQEGLFDNGEGGWDRRYALRMEAEQSDSNTEILSEPFLSASIGRRTSRYCRQKALANALRSIFHDVGRPQPVIS